MGFTNSRGPPQLLRRDGSGKTANKTQAQESARGTMLQNKKLKELEAAVERKRAALAATEAALAELLAATEPTADLAAEMRRAQDLQVKREAYQRVAAAQRRELETAQADVERERIPVLRAELARIESQAQATIDEIGKLTWKALELAATHRQVQDAWGAVASQLDGPMPFVRSRHADLLRASWELACKQLAEIGEGVMVGGPAGPEFITTAAFAAREAESQRQHALQVEAIEKQRAAERQAAASNGGVIVR